MFRLIASVLGAGDVEQRHSERSEESVGIWKQMLRLAQHDVSRLGLCLTIGVALLAHDAAQAQTTASPAVSQSAPTSQPATASRPASQRIVLLERYPTTLTEALTDPTQACAWEFTPDDIYEISKFQFEGDDGLRVRIGPADVGIGHCEHGAVWAVILPRKRSQMVSSAARVTEQPEHVWLRFHPAYIGTLLPPQTVRGPGNPARFARMQRIAVHKMRASYHAGKRAMIPPPSTVILDVDTRDGVRRFFVVDRIADTTRYVPSFENQIVPATTPISGKEATRMFETVWQAFDREYPGFALRPEVDWNAEREKYRARAAQCANTYELATVLAEMLRPLRDRHIGISVGSESVPVFESPRPLNANLEAIPHIVGELHRAQGDVRWTLTKDGIGYILIPQWRSPMIPIAVDSALEELKNARGLIIDVRVNGGGDETKAQVVAGRFATKPVVYAYNRVRTGPKHDDLSDMRPRSVNPRGPWTFEKPVIVLIGQRAMSSNESFIAMMGELPQVTLMGDHTAGSSGNPKTLKLGNDLQVRMPQWIDYRPDKKPLDAIGIEPDVRFEGGRDAFEGRDALLAAALERMRKTVAPTSQPG